MKPIMKTLSNRAVGKLEVEKDTVFRDGELTGFGALPWTTGTSYRRCPWCIFTPPRRYIISPPLTEGSNSTVSDNGRWSLAPADASVEEGVSGAAVAPGREDAPADRVSANSHHGSERLAMFQLTTLIIGRRFPPQSWRICMADTAVQERSVYIRFLFWAVDF